MLRIHNTESGKLENFEPLEKGKVKIYICGPTVYDYLHVGNFRGPVFFNLVRNWLLESGYKVEYATNFTDVDDKIIIRANERGVKSEDLAASYIEEYKKDFASLGLRTPDRYPKVTESMDEIRSMITKLIENKKAYVADGDVMYSIEKFPDYGKLSGRNVEDLQAGARVEVDKKKKSPLDFALWKGAKPGEPFWESPWGPGRPGWHIECSAMVEKIFGDQIDIHGGGTDLIFPHHENEIAQSEGCTGKHYVKYWMHWNMLNFGSQKMSKSLGNFVTMREFLGKYNSEIYKWMILSVHYRSPSDFSDEAVDRAVSNLARIYSAMAVAESLLAGQKVPVDPAFEKITQEAWGKMAESLDDDFGTPNAMAALFEVVRQFNNQVKRGIKANAAVLGKAQSFIDFARKMGQLMSMFQEPADGFLLKLDNMLLEKMNVRRGDVDKLVAERSQARANKDFAKSDELRKNLIDMGISVSDTPEGSFWEVTK
jgi:cysteinyl-tRNA synthetase